MLGRSFTRTLRSQPQPYHFSLPGGKVTSASASISISSNNGSSVRTAVAASSRGGEYHVRRNSSSSSHPKSSNNPAPGSGSASTSEGQRPGSTGASDSNSTASTTPQTNVLDGTQEQPQKQQHKSIHNSRRRTKTLASPIALAAESASRTGGHTSAVSSVSEQSTRSRDSQSRAPAASDAFVGMPAVPSTEHLQHSDVHLSALFAQHRPIAANPAVPFPPAISHTKFNTLFDLPKSAHKPNDVIYTLNTTIRSLENAQGNTVVQVTDANGVTHLDGPPTHSLNDLMQSHKPFHKPPAPIPLDEESQRGAASASSAVENALRIKQTRDAARQRLEQSTTQVSSSEAVHATETATGQSKRSFTAKININIEPVAAQASSTEPNTESSSAHSKAPTSRAGSSIAPASRTSYSAYITDFREVPPTSNAATQTGVLVDRGLLPAHIANATTRLSGRRRESEEEQQRSFAERVDAARAAQLRRWSVGRSANHVLLAAANAASPRGVATWRLISVKRQRKLKMKRHKYKKLMRQQRNERRREGRN